MEKTFGVFSKHFTLIEAFKKEAEKLGWTYNCSFNEFSENKFNGGRNLHFERYWDVDDDYLFSLSSTSKNHPCLYLPQDWNEAIALLNKPIITEVTILDIARWKGVSVENIRVKYK